MLSNKQKRYLVCTLTVALLLSITAVSLVQARTEDESPPAVDENGQPTTDTPTLIMTQDSNATVPEDQTEQPNLYQAQDPQTAVDDNSTGVTAQDDAEGSQENSLISTQTSPDCTVLILGVAGVIAVTAAIGAFLLVRKRKAAN